MKRDGKLLFGVWASAIFAAGLVLLPLFVPGYDAVRQTVSEIGEADSPMRGHFAAMLLLVAFCLAVFAAGVWGAARQGRHGIVSVVCIAWMAVAAAAIGMFAFPHPLHNVFGISELIAYQAPLAFALEWRKDPRSKGAVLFSAILYALMLASIVLNLSSLARDGAIWHAVGPIYGLVQRSLFACFFVWTAGVGWMLWRKIERSDPDLSPAPSRPVM